MLIGHYPGQFLSSKVNRQIVRKRQLRSPKAQPHGAKSPPPPPQKKTQTKVTKSTQYLSQYMPKATVVVRSSSSGPKSCSKGQCQASRTSRPQIPLQSLILITITKRSDRLSLAKFYFLLFFSNRKNGYISVKSIILFFRQWLEKNTLRFLCCCLP